MSAPATAIPPAAAARDVRRAGGPRVLGILAAAVLIAAGSYAATMSGPADSLDTDSPHSDPPAQVAPLQVPGAVAGAGSAFLAPGSLERIDRSIATWTRNLDANPRDFISATNLATLYHGRGRLSGDLADQERALAAARTAIAIAPTSGAARSLEAAILYTLHDFPAALAAAESLYRDDPGQVGALATIADARLELGRIDEARAALESLRLMAAGPALDVRFARLAYLTGDALEALRLALGARDAATAALAADGTATNLGFYHYAVGEYARLAGDAATAREGYVAALAERASDLGALIGLARIDAFDGRTADAIAGLERAVSIAPQPDALALLGDLLAASGDAAAAADRYATVRLIAALSAIDGAVFDRQLLLFELDHGGATEATLQRATAAAEIRPDAAGHDLVAWAAYRLGRFEEAGVASDLARATGIVDARILYHAGRIVIALGDVAAGEALLREALALGPGLDPAERDGATID